MMYHHLYLTKYYGTNFIFQDVNDHAPRFDRESYEWLLPENSPDFPVPFFVYADDADENGTENAEVQFNTWADIMLMFDRLLGPLIITYIIL